MSIWRVSQDLPEHFLDELYTGYPVEDSDDSFDLELDSVIEEIGPKPTTPHNNLCSPVRDDQSGDDEENRFSTASPEVRDRSPIRRDESPDAQRGSRARRSGGRGVRGAVGQGRGRGQPRRGRRGRQEVAHPLTQIYLTDEHVPSELVSSARDVVRKETRMRDVFRARDGLNESEDDECFIASDGSDSLHFEWSPMESFQGQEEKFVPERTGSVQSYNSAYDAFRSFWDDDILGLIVNETNSHAAKIKSAAFQSAWIPTNIDEILCLFSFWMMLAIIRMPTMASCFSDDPLLKTDIFRSIFTRMRYENLSRALSFVDSDPASDDRNPSNTGDARKQDRVHCLRPIITHLNAKFQSNYILSKDICIGVSLTPWKGRLDIKQYIRSKAAKNGIKTFELCESVTGYVWSFIVHTGKQLNSDLDKTPGELKSTSVVKKLIGPLLHKGYRLFMDDWFNSPLLARFLKRNGTDCVGTLRACRKYVPVLITKAPLEKGQVVARHSGDISLLAWQDKERVTMISTCHDASSALPTVSSNSTSRPAPFKPKMVLDYNKFMGGVDLKDQMLKSYLLERKRCAKWYMKLFKRLLNYSINNSRIILQSSTRKHHDHLSFRLKLVDSILSNHLSRCPSKRTYQVSSATHNHQKLVIPAHWPIRLNQTEGSIATSRSHRKRCVVCLREGRKSIRTAYCCETCGVPLCINSCFKVYHIS